MREILQVGLQDEQYTAMLARYHFALRDLEQLKQVGGLAQQVSEPVMYWEKEEDTGRIAVIVTLGGGIDELQSRYLAKERLSESYMAECTGMELLRAAYEQTAQRIHDRTGKWPTDFSFVGDREPFSRMEEIFGRLAPEGVSYNQAYMLTPKKTVVFLTGLCGERKDSYCRICTDCANLSCPNRLPDDEAGRPQETENLNYGYQRIFGKAADKRKDR